MKHGSVPSVFRTLTGNGQASKQEEERTGRSAIGFAVALRKMLTGRKAGIEYLCSDQDYYRFISPV
ncbi:hypothetical protein BH09PSE5_BH09PSE5_16030 [soil metagenome]